MNCELVQDGFLDYLEGLMEEPQLSQVRAHLDSCASCRFGLQQTRELIGAMHDVKSGQERAASSKTTGPASAMPMAAWRPGSRLGDFEILEEIGRGGMGVVYRARQMSLGRLVALKILPSLLTAVRSAVARFQKEAQAAAKLHHTNIVPVYAQGEFEGHFYYAMELIEGDGLDRILRRDPEHFVDLLSPHDTIGKGGHRHLARLMAGVAEGLEHAHRQGILHRDIKPQNLLLGSDGQLHITDFGLARILDEPSLTLSGDMLGTPAYMSPEQVAADRKKIDHRTDIYSLGVTFYELLTGHRPFEGSTREQTIARICTREPRPLRKWNPNIPIDLETICLRAMEKEPNRRYARAGDLAAELRRFSDDRPIVSRRVGPIEKAVKWIRRHPARAAIIFLSVVLTVGATTWRIQSIRERRERGERLVQEAFDRLAYEDYRDAEIPQKLLAEAITLEPDEFRLRVTLGLAHVLDDPAVAVEHLQWAIAHRPTDTQTMYLLAWALRQKYDRIAPEVRAWLAKADALGGPTTAAGHFFRGQTVVRENPGESATSYRRAQELRSNYTQAILHLGRAINHEMYHERRLENFGEAERMLLTACDLQFDKAYPRYLLSLAYRISAEIYERAGDIARAEERFKLALDAAVDAQAKEPTSPRGYAAIAEYWESRRDYLRAVEARDAGEKYCQKHEASVELRQYRWRVLYWAGLYDRALQDLRALEESVAENDDRKIWYIGMFPSLIQAERGDDAKAQILARRMAERQPQDLRAVLSSVCMLRVLGRNEDADLLLRQYRGPLAFTAPHGTYPPKGWSEALARFASGQIAWNDLGLLAGEDKGNKLLWPIPHFIQASRLLADGRRSEALFEFRKCESTYDFEDYCYMARVFVRRMESDPVWPSWVAQDAKTAASSP